MKQELVQNNYQKHNVLTKEDIWELGTMINDVLECIYKNKGAELFNQLDNINAKFDNILDYRHLLNNEQINTSVLGDMASRIREEITNMQEVKITLSFSPKRDFVNALYGWFLGVIPKSFILNIKKDEVIVGGIVFDLKGRHYDLSLKKIIDNYLSANRDCVLSKL